MSIILGLNCNHADSSACIFKDGKLLLQLKKKELIELNTGLVYRLPQLKNVWIIQK